MLDVEAVFPRGDAARSFADWARYAPGGCRPDIKQGGQNTRVRCRVQQDPHAYVHLVRGLAECNRLLRARAVYPNIYESGVRYGYVETPGSVELLSLPLLFQRGWGACGELAAARASEDDALGLHLYRVGRNASGGTLYHVVVRHPNGQLEDPSAALGGLQHLMSTN